MAIRFRLTVTDATGSHEYLQQTLTSVRAWCGTVGWLSLLVVPESALRMRRRALVVTGGPMIRVGH